MDKELNGGNLVSEREDVQAASASNQKPHNVDLNVGARNLPAKESSLRTGSIRIDE
jgi:hypothetical protein